MSSAIKSSSQNESCLAIKCADVSKYFPLEGKLSFWQVLTKDGLDCKEIIALDNITLAIGDGCIVGVLGKNGAGKSTLLRVLAKVYSPSSGVVDVSGSVGGLFELGGMGGFYLSGRQYARRYLRLMLENESLLPSLLEDIHEFSELGSAFDERIHTYSTGMRSRLYFSVVTALKNQVYLIDELLSVGDEHFQSKCWQRVRELLKNGSAAIIVTHDWTSILKLCETSHILDQGKIIFTGLSDKAIVKYLDIPRNKPEYAEFIIEESKEFILYAGQDSELELRIDLFESAPIYLSISIEKLHVGADWEIMMMAKDLYIAEQAGTYVANVKIPRCPFVQGEYILNLWLTMHESNDQPQSITCDSRTWTSGNGMKLIVKGKTENGGFKLPFVAQKLALQV